MTRAELAKGLGTKIDILNKICDDLGIKNKEIKDDEVVDIKIKYLDLYKNNIVMQRDELKINQKQFEDYKKEEKNKLKEKQIQDEILHKQKLEEMRMKKLEELSTDFQERLSKEYEIINEKFIEISKKESKFQEKESQYKLFETEKELFKSEKEKLLSEHKQWIEEQKKIEINKLVEERSKEFKEINEIRQRLHKDSEIKIEKKEEELREKEAQLKTKIAEVKAKEKSLEVYKESISTQEKEKASLEIKMYKEKIKSFEKSNQVLLEELEELRNNLSKFEQINDRDLFGELKEKQQELTRVKKLLEETVKQKNDLEINLDDIVVTHEKEKRILVDENNQLLKDNLEVELLKSRKVILEDQLDSKKENIEILKGERKDLKEQLNSIYSDGTEDKKRFEEIKEIQIPKFAKDYFNPLDTQISITDEIKYLNSIQNNIDKYYGIEKAFPKRLLYAFHTALKCSEFSPLAVLSGVSGTGKSELPKLYSHFGGFHFLAEAVQPTWDSPASMIGYYNTIDRKFDSTNILKFLIQTSLSKDESSFGLKESMNMILLDEMNLAHIELYFADFLSKFEQRRGSKKGKVNIDIQLGTAYNHKLPLDRNTLWIGTMNEDETTKSLSDKVLDRAFSINFPRPTKLKSRVKLQSLEDIKAFEYLHRDTWNKWIQKESLFIGERSEAIEKYKEISNKINEHLAPTGRAIGHRVWQSMEYYISNHPDVIQNINNDEEFSEKIKLAFEDQLVQKIMPKLRGIEVHGKEKDALMNIKDILNQNKFTVTEDFELSMDNPYGQFIWNSANYLKED